MDSVYRSRYEFPEMSFILISLPSTGYWRNEAEDDQNINNT